MTEQIATKNLQYLSDILGAEKLLQAKLAQYSQSCTDDNLQKLFSKMQKSQKSNYDTVFAYLKSHS